MDFDDIKRYLPQFLSDMDKEKLFEQFSNFTDNMNKIFMLSSDFTNGIIQSDIVDNIPFISLPNIEVANVKVMILSNSCDITPENPRSIPPSVAYVPIMPLKKLEVFLINKGKDKDQINGIISAIKKQHTTSMFYIPRGLYLEEDSVALFDKVLHCKRDDFFNLAMQNDGKKLASLNNYGFYIFLLKLSIHFTRIHENINRN